MLKWINNDCDNGSNVAYRRKSMNQKTTTKPAMFCNLNPPIVDQRLLLSFVDPKYSLNDAFN